MTEAAHEHTHVTEVSDRGSPATRILASSARLFVPHGPDKGRACRVGARPIIVGAEAGCDLVLSDRSVSRRHAEVHRDGDMVFVRDLDSTNGTFYHEARVREVSVPIGGQVSFGKTSVKVTPDEIPLASEPIGEEKLGPLVGRDRRMREIFGLVRDIAASDATVVIEGETGTGKELVAQAIHELSSRGNGPFVVFDCTSQPKDLVESALFGHVKGAFTGATGQRQGAFPRAHGGSIFLDELGELELDLQPKLLRVLESREVQRVGGEGYDRVDVRVVAATNRSLRSEVRSGTFREDLYYRLAVIKIHLPPLRERPDDIELLVEHFIAHIGAEFTPSRESLEALKQHPWPGNVRELRNLVERAGALSRGRQNVDLTQFLQVDFLDEALPSQDGEEERPDLSGLSFKEAKGRLISDFESRYVESLLRAHDNNISVAAREAGVDRKHFKDLMRKYKIEARPGEKADE